MTYQVPDGQIGVLQSQGAIPIFRFVKPHTVAGYVIICGAGDLAIGVNQQLTVQDGACGFNMAGISKIELGGTVVAGNPLTPDASGRAVLATGDAPVAGYALEGSTVGAIIAMLVMPGTVSVALSLAIGGLTAGQKIAGGIHTQAAAADTVATGLATVTSATGSFRDAPSVKQLFVEVSQGDQVSAPVAGSIIISTFKPTAVNDVTPVAATDFSENKKIAWIAIGT